MKVKSDFVTNSSSASFILTLKTEDDHLSVSEFTDLFNIYMEDFIRRHPGKIRFWDGSKIELVSDEEFTGNTFRVTDWTSMNNGSIEDIPEYMRELMINYFVNDRNWKFEIDSFETIDD